MRRRPPRPVTPEICLRQADLSEESGSSSSIGESTRFGGDLERLLFEGVEEVLEVVDFADGIALVGDATFGVDGAFTCDADLLVGTAFRDPILGDNGFGDDSLDTFDFEDDFFSVDPSGIDVVFEGAVFVTVAGGGVAFEGATFGVVSLGVASFGNLVFDGEAAAFVGASFTSLFFDVATVAGLGSGARSTSDATGALVVGAVNCPLAIWRARSFTLINILTEQ